MCCVVQQLEDQDVRVGREVRSPCSQGYDSFSEAYDASRYECCCQSTDYVLSLRAGAHVPMPHPSAPQEVKASFQSFLAKIEKSAHSNRTSIPATASPHSSYTAYWDAPPRLTRTIPLEDLEMEVIQVSDSFVHHIF